MVNCAIEPFDTCSICQQGIVEGQAYHSFKQAHWDCAYPNGKQPTKTLREIIEEGDRAIEKLNALTVEVTGIAPRKPRKKRVREGEGPTALKVKKLASEAVARALGVESVFDVTMWNQQGAHRGPHWDLDTWGIHFSFVHDGHVFKGQGSSLSTMTECAKIGKLVASVPPREGWTTFYIEPAYDKPADVY